MSDYEERRQQRREEKHRYESDVMYEVWRSGGNPDCIEYDRVSDHHSNGDSYEAAVWDELRMQTPRPSEEEHYKKSSYRNES